MYAHPFVSLVHQQITMDEGDAYVALLLHKR